MLLAVWATVRYVIRPELHEVPGHRLLMNPAAATTLALLLIATLLVVIRPEWKLGRRIALAVGHVVGSFAVVAQIFTTPFVGAWQRPSGLANATAVMIALASVALVIRSRVPRIGKIRRHLGLGCVTIVVATASIGAIAWAIGEPAVMRPIIDGGSLGSEVTLIILGLVLGGELGGWELLGGFLLSPGKDQMQHALRPEEDERKYVTLATLLLVVAGLIVVTALYLRQAAIQERRELTENFVSVSSLTANDVGRWLSERHGDANMIMRSPTIAEFAHQLAQDPHNAPVRERLEALAQVQRESYGYTGIEVLGPEGQSLLRVPSDLTPTQLNAKLIATTRAQRQIGVSDPYDDGTGSLWVDIIAPMFRVGVSPPEFAGYFVFRVNIASQINRIVQQSRLPGETTENVLCRRQGDWIAILSRRAPDSGQIRPLVLPADDLILVSAGALAGAYGRFLKGHDYRGVTVVAAAAPVPGSDWAIVTKQDAEEAFKPVREEAFRIVLSDVFMLMVIGLVARGAWIRHYRAVVAARAASERQRDELERRFGLVMKHANDAILLFDSTMRLVEANERALQSYGRTIEELRTMTANDLRAPTARDATRADWEKARNTDGGLVFETVHLRKDGTSFPVEVSSRRVFLDGSPHVLSIVRDITVRRAHEHEIDQLGRLFQLLCTINQAVVQSRDQADAFDRVCRALIEVGRFKMVWIGWLNRETGFATPVAVAGDEAGFTTGLRIAYRADGPGGMSPCGLAMREERTQVYNELRTDPLAMPWMKAAAATGTGSLISLPLRQDKAVAGVLSVHAAEVHYFSPRVISLLEEAADDISFALDAFARERAKVEVNARLAASEARMNFVMAASPAAIYAIRAGGAYETVFMSENVRTLLGYEAEEFTSNPGFWHDGVHPEDRAAAIEAMTSAASNDRVSREYRFRHRNGTYRWMRDESRLVRDARTLEPAEHVGYWLDITESKRLEEEAKRQEARFRAIFEMAPVGISLTSSPKRGGSEFRMLVNSEHVRLTGVSAADSNIDGIFKSVTHPDDWARQQELAKDYAPDRNNQLTLDKRYLHPGGKVVWANLSSRYFRDPVTLEYMSLTVITDITARKKAEADLQTREEIFANIVGQAGDAIALIDVDTGLFVEFNTAAHTLLGYSREEFARIGLWGVQAEHSPEQIRANLNRLRTDGALQFVTKHRHRDGSLRDVRVSSQFLQLHGRTYVTTVWSDITEQRRGEENLRKLSRIVEQAPLSVAITDLNGAIEYVNPHFCVATGYTAKEVLGQNPRILKSGQTPAEMYVEMWKTLTSGQTWRGELHNRRKTGEQFVELAVIAPVVGEDGKPTHYVALKEDISERTRVQSALQQSEERFRAIFDQSTVGMFETTPQGRLTRANPHLCQMLGRPAGELLGRHWHEFLAAPPAEAPSAPPKGPEERRFVGSDGRLFWGLITSRLEQQAGQSLGYICTLQDITDQVEGRETLRRFNVDLEDKVSQRTAELAASNREVQALLNAVPDMVLRMREDGEVLNCQRSHDSEALMSLCCQGDCQPAHCANATLLDPCLVIGRSALRRGTTVTEETEIMVGGEVLALELRSAPIGAGEFVVFVRDITDRKKLDTEIHAMLERERELSEMKTRFISVTSHEFRTPMAAAVASAELLHHHYDRVTPEKREELFSRIKDAMQRMTSMLDEILTLSRIDSGHQPTVLNPIDLRKFVADIVEEVRLADHEAHHFEFETRGQTEPFVTDPLQLRQILSNLLSNAARYSPKGTPVTVGLELAADGCTLEVADRGIGVPPTDLQRIFEPFERGSNVGGIKGTGLGLNIVLRMTQLLGGTIVASPRPGGGSVFTVRLPRPADAPKRPQPTRRGRR
ncbi:MAG TPA: PAS domain S-box protein [Opitutaceae bacterium]|nr:PAS domain S-box protein [Opitutaceae bacterium]